MCAVWKRTSWAMLDIMGDVGHEATHQHTESHRKEDGKVVEEETASEHNPRERKRKERSTTQRTQRTSGRTVDRWILGIVVRDNPGTPQRTVRTGEKQMIGTQQSRVLKHQQRLKNFNMRPFAIFFLPVVSKPFSLTDWTLLSEPSHVAWMSLHARLLFLQITLRRAGT